MTLAGTSDRALFPSLHLPSNGALTARPGMDELWTLSGWVTKIKEAWARGASATMSLAETVARAKATLNRGEWTTLWRSHETDLPFGRRKAEMFVAIGKTMGDLNAHDRARLPLAWHTLYVLAALGRALIEQLIAQARIHPRLTVSEAKELVAEFKPARPGSRARPGVKLRLSRFAHFVRTTLPNWTQERPRLRPL